MTIHRYTIVSCGAREEDRGSYLSVEDVLSFLDDLTNNDDPDTIRGKIDILKEQLS